MNKDYKSEPIRQPVVTNSHAKESVAMINCAPERKDPSKLDKETILMRRAAFEGARKLVEDLQRNVIVATNPIPPSFKDETWPEFLKSDTHDEFMNKFYKQKEVEAKITKEYEEKCFLTLQLAGYNNLNKHDLVAMHYEILLNHSDVIVNRIFPNLVNFLNKTCKHKVLIDIVRGDSPEGTIDKGWEVCKGLTYGSMKRGTIAARKNFKLPDGEQDDWLEVQDITEIFKLNKALFLK